MTNKSLRRLIEAQENFVITAEFVPLPGHNLANFRKFLQGYTQKKIKYPLGLSSLELLSPKVQEE